MGERAEMVDALALAMGRVSEAGGLVVALMVGGSFVRKEVAAPHDIDGVIFYSGGREETPRRLLNESALWKLNRLDMRCIPFDASPAIALKAAAFFSVLYSVNRDGAGAPNGCLLVLP